MQIRYRLLLAVVIVLICAANPACAWLYDAGVEQHAGAQVNYGSNCEWAAERFTVQSDCYATTFGAALARAEIGVGFYMNLFTTWNGMPGAPIAKLSQPLVPLGPIWTYYYGTLNTPVFLKANTLYALVLVPTSPDLLGSVSWGNKSGTYYGLGTSDHGDTWHQLEHPLCVRVDGYAVPEPSSMAALIFAILGSSILKKKSS